MPNTIKIVLALVGLAFSGCNQQPAPVAQPAVTGGPSDVATQSTGEPETSTDASEPNTDSSTEASGVSLTLASLDEIQSVIKSAGRPVVIDFWSTSCVPCMQEFPGLVKLHNEHGTSVMCVSVCMDYIGLKNQPPESLTDDVNNFLNAQKATLTNYLSTTPDEDIYTALDLESIPAVFVYAADGSIAKRFVDSGKDTAFTYEEDVTPFVKQLLN